MQYSGDERVKHDSNRLNAQRLQSIYICLLWISVWHHFLSLSNCNGEIMTCTNSDLYFQMRKKSAYNSLPYLCRARVVFPQLRPCCATFLLDNLYLRGLAREQESHFVKAGSNMAQKRDFSELSEMNTKQTKCIVPSGPFMAWSEDFLICECFDQKTTDYTPTHVCEGM